MRHFWKSSGAENHETLLSVIGIAVLYAIEKALSHKAFGADYIENILYQEMTPQRSHPPVKLKDDALNRIRLTEPCLADYDSLILKRRHDDD